MKFEHVKTNLLKENEYNPNEMSTSQFEHLKGEIQKAGFTQPITLNKDLMIIDGAHRYRAALELGHETVPCIILETSTEEDMIQTINLNLIKGEFNPIKYAHMLKILTEKIQLPALLERIRMTENEYDQYLKLLTLPEALLPPITDIIVDTVEYTFIVPKDQETIINNALHHADKNNTNTAFTKIINDYAQRTSNQPTP